MLSELFFIGTVEETGSVKSFDGKEVIVFKTNDAFASLEEK
jgi:hypothetical protein